MGDLIYIKRAHCVILVHLVSSAERNNSSITAINISVVLSCK